MSGLASIFDPSGFPPRWHCGEWSALLGWTHITADVVTWASYTAIPLVIAFYLRKRSGPVPQVLWLFVAFILTCGVTHLVEAVIFWIPVYRLSAVLKVATASVSFATVLTLLRTTPRALDDPEVQAMADRLTVERNQALADLAEANAALEEANAELEAKVEARTQALLAANAVLREEIEERERVTADLRETQVMLTEAHRMAGLGSWRLDAVKDEIIWSDTLYEMIGLPAGHDLGTAQDHLRELYVPEDEARLARAVEAALEDGTPYEIELELQGNFRIEHLRAKGRPIRDAEGAIVGLEGTVLDITGQVRQQRDLAEANQRLEQAVADATSELQATVEELGRANEDLERANVDLASFVHMASHDLRAPLRSLVACTEMLPEHLGDALPSRAERDLGFIRRSALRMRRLVEALVELSDAGRGSTRLEDCDLGEVARAVLEDLEPQGQGAKIEVPQLPRLVTDPGLVERVYANLLGNALKFAGEHPRVRLTVETADDRWILGVQDDGPGVPPEERAKLFRPFFRGAARSKTDGSGLGLTIAQRAVERLGGRIWVEGEAGAHFRFELPRAPDSAG